MRSRRCLRSVLVLSTLPLGQIVAGVDICVMHHHEGDPGPVDDLVLDPGTPKQRTLLDVTQYNFHDQRAYNLEKPVLISLNDSVQITCTYDPELAAELPALRKVPPHFVTWGDGSVDEMCLGMIMTIPPVSVH